MVKLQDEVTGSFWSCRVAGSDETYTPPATYTAWGHSRCDAEGAAAGYGVADGYGDVSNVEDVVDDTEDTDGGSDDKLTVTRLQGE
jgi:hypothetical protein